MTAPVDGARSALAPATWHKSLRLRYEINEFQQMFILQCMHARLGPNYLQVEKDWGRIRHWQLRLHVKGMVLGCLCSSESSYPSPSVVMQALQSETACHCIAGPGKALRAGDLAPPGFPQDPNLRRIALT